MRQGRPLPDEEEQDHRARRLGHAHRRPTAAIDVKAADGDTASHTFDNLIIATGATVRLVPGTSLSEHVVTYEEQILDDELPGSIIIAGSGAIGVEFAYVMNNFGVDVTIVEFLDRMVPTEDADVSKELLKHYKKLGVKVLLSTKVESIEDTGDTVKVTGQPGRRRRPAGARGRQGARRRSASRRGVEGYGLEAAGVETHRPRRDRGRRAAAAPTSTNVYAIGDVTGKLMLAHAAEAMGVVAAETIAGAETMEIDFDMIPRATFCQPQIASFGYSEEQAKEKGYDVKTATFPFSANGKAQGLGDAVGFVKIVADAEHNEIVGAHMIGPEVTELLPALTLAQQWDLTADEVARNVFAHPTLSEAVKEAVARHRRAHDQPLTRRDSDPERSDVGQRADLAASEGAGAEHSALGADRHRLWTSRQHWQSPPLALPGAR